MCSNKADVKSETEHLNDMDFFRKRKKYVFKTLPIVTQAQDPFPLYIVFWHR
ncbi:hypothetical protein AEQU3_03463 [Aequorivita antarctica]|nr:hypothetical protein AEQU3_03463 [Aequorivita antarctica]